MKRCLPIFNVKLAQRDLAPLYRLRGRDGEGKTGMARFIIRGGIIAIPALLLFSISAHGELNKWVDGRGKVHYSDELPPPNVKAKTLATPSAVSGVPAQSSLAEREAERKKALNAKEEDAQKAAQKEKDELAKQKNCAGAKANLNTFQSSAPVVTYNDKGERNIMDDSARQQNIEEANKQISLYCN